MDITVTCSAGLGNRLINLYTTQYIYLRHGIKFRYSWPVQDDVQVARLTDLFDYKFDECFDDYGELQKIEVQKTDTILTKDELDKNIHWISPDARFEGDSEVDYTQAFNSIPLRSDIKDKANSLQTTKNVIGLHIRGGDLKTANNHVDDLRFVSKKTMDKLLKKIEIILSTNKNQKFFVSCEDYCDKYIIEKKFSGNVMFLDCERSRCGVLGIQHAIAELVILSRCSMIIGNISSSFAGVAARVGRIKYEIL